MCINICTNINVYISGISACVHTCVYVCVYMQISAYVCTHTHMHTGSFYGIILLCNLLWFIYKYTISIICSHQQVYFYRKGYIQQAN